MDLQSRYTNKHILNFNMLYNVNVILYKLLCGKQLLVEEYKHLIYRFYLTEEFVHWNFGKFWKQSLSFVVMRTGTCMSVTQK